ncbi:hypothetical protein [Salinicoccus albus]|uniref:hypothetical protein n=1 Tax=Salinicoccus albus TaxID=418756 RepID=UPI000361EC90|nr:hypothetical protein [Salinicoccus albus]
MLSPKPDNQRPLLGWKKLDETLQANFKVSHKNEEPKASIDAGRYEMSPDEIKSEAEKQGYKVTVSGNHITFE